MLAVVTFLTFGLCSCSDDEDSRAFDTAQIVGVKIDGELFLPATGDNASETRVNVPAGRDLSQVSLQVLVANGNLVNFQNEAKYDCRKPLDLTIAGFNGETVQTKLRIVSAPKLTNFVIKGLTVPTSDIHENATGIIVQVPKGTDLTKLEVTMEFTNGTLIDFTNGQVRDYTNPVKFSIKGVDEETIYNYELMITTEEVGPASISAISVNGVKSDSVVTKNGKVVPYIPALLDFTSADIEISTGYGNKIEDGFTGKGLNLMTGDNKVTITGTNGVPTDFVIGVPQLSFAPAIAMQYDALGMGANDLCAVGFSGNYLLAGNYTSTAKTPIYFDFSGNKVGQLDATGVNVTGYGHRKFATDSKGAILGLSLGMSGGEQWIYKWDSVTGQASEYISFSKDNLGVDYNPRSGGICIEGALDGDAIITMTIAQKQEAFVWTVKGGVLNSTPTKVMFPYAGASYYWSLVPMPSGIEGYLGMVTNNAVDNAGVVRIDGNMQEMFRVGGFYCTDGKVIKHNGRTYLAYTAHSNSKGIMRLCDITDGSKEAYSTPIFEQVMATQGANGNATMDADLTIIDGKLYAAFACTNLGLYMYEFGK